MLNCSYFITKLKNKVRVKSFECMLILFAFFFIKGVSSLLSKILNWFIQFSTIHKFVLIFHYFKTLFLLPLGSKLFRCRMFAILIQQVLFWWFPTAFFQFHSIACKRHFTYAKKYFHVSSFLLKRITYLFGIICFIHECKNADLWIFVGWKKYYTNTKLM